MFLKYIIKTYNHYGIKFFLKFKMILIEKLNLNCFLQLKKFNFFFFFFTQWVGTCLSPFLCGGWGQLVRVNSPLLSCGSWGLNPCHLTSPGLEVLMSEKMWWFPFTLGPGNRAVFQAAASYCGGNAHARSGNGIRLNWTGTSSVKFSQQSGNIAQRHPRCIEMQTHGRASATKSARGSVRRQ